MLTSTFWASVDSERVPAGSKPSGGENWANVCTLPPLRGAPDGPCDTLDPLLPAPPRLPQPNSVTPASPAPAAPAPAKNRRRFTPLVYTLQPLPAIHPPLKSPLPR